MLLPIDSAEQTELSLALKADEVLRGRGYEAGEAARGTIMKSFVLDLTESRCQHLFLLPFFETLHTLLIYEAQIDRGKQSLAIRAETKERSFSDAENDRVDVVLQAISTEQMAVAARDALANGNIL